MPEPSGGAVDMHDEPDLEPIVAGRIEVGRVVFECLAGAIDLFPRKPGVTFEPRRQRRRVAVRAGPTAPSQPWRRSRTSGEPGPRRRLARREKQVVSLAPPAMVGRFRGDCGADVRAICSRLRPAAKSRRAKTPWQGRARYRSTPWAEIEARRWSFPAPPWRWSGIPTSTFLLVGDRARIEPHLAEHPALAERSRIVHTDIAVEMQDKPSQAVRRGRGSSMWLAIEAVQKGEADCAVSAGNTGALMAMAKLILRHHARHRAARHRRPVADRRPQLHRPGPRRQHRRHRPPARRFRADGRRDGARAVPHRAPAGRAPQHRRRGDQGHRGGQAGARLAQGERPADRLSRLRRRRPDRAGHRRCGRRRGLRRQHRAQDRRGHRQADGGLRARGARPARSRPSSARCWPSAACGRSESAWTRAASTAGRSWGSMAL